ncbi:MAG: chitobiase/beta-hexosaminidase C-terminal domain-containing protein [Prevotella sp.]|nr:chitobiase/beta-hexosaminidase C-terminal domain-containing protein [Prevotella sp.]
MRRYKLLLIALAWLAGAASLHADIIQFGSLEDTEWTATADDGCSNGSTIVLDGVVVTIGSAEDAEVSWSWNAKNAGLIPTQMPSTEGTVESLITSFSDVEPFGELPTHGAFFKIQPSRPGNITFRGKASANEAQPLIFVTCYKDNPTIIEANITPWDNSVTEWTYEVDTEHDYYFFQQSYPGQLTAYRFTFRGVAFEATGEAPPPVDQRNVGFLYNGDLSADLAYKVITRDRSNKVTPIEANKAFTVEDFADYEVITVSSTVDNDVAIASLKEVHPYLPMLNLNPLIYEKWGYGEVVDAGIMFATTRNPNHPLFRNLPLIEDPDAEEPTYVLEVSTYSSFPGLHLSGIFANDPILAVAYDNEDVVAIHSHNLSRNGYLYIPYTQETLADAVTPEIITYAIAMMNGTKQPATKAPLPTFALEYDYQQTIVSIADAAPEAEIFYTLDGTTPTEASTRYTGPFTVSEETTVMAVARGEGYLLSDVAERYIDIRLVCPPPTFSMERHDGQTVVTISSDLDGASIYYNYKGDNTAGRSTLYTGPITLTSGRTIYAFQTCPDYLNSRVGSAEVVVTNPRVRVDILSKMDANQEEYYSQTNPDTQTGNAGYYFSWGSTAMDNMGQEEVVDFGNGWSVRSRGQRIAWENVTPAFNYGDDASGSFNPMTVEDEDARLPVSSGLIDLHDWNTQHPANAMIESTQAFAGPFDVVAYMVNENGNIGFGDTSVSEWAATSADGCNNGSTITLNGVVVTLGSPDDADVTWSWHAGNAGLLPTQMPSTDGTAETLITEFSEEEPFGTLPTHGAFFKIEPTKAGVITIKGKASASADQPLVFVTLDKNNPTSILAASITPWDNSVTEWSYEVDANHAYIFFQLAYPEKLNAYRFTLRGFAFEAFEGGSGESVVAPSAPLAARLVVEVAASNGTGAEWTQIGEPIALPDARRLYCKVVRSYEGATPVFVRTRIVNDVPRAGIFNIYLAYEGEESKRIIQEQSTGITNVQPSVVLPAGIYSISGTRQNEMRRGLNIIVSQDGSVKKVYVK